MGPELLLQHLYRLLEAIKKNAGFSDQETATIFYTTFRWQFLQERNFFFPLQKCQPTVSTYCINMKRELKSTNGDIKRGDATQWELCLCAKIFDMWCWYQIWYYLKKKQLNLLLLNL